MRIIFLMIKILVVNCTENLQISKGSNTKLTFVVESNFDEFKLIPNMIGEINFQLVPNLLGINLVSLCLPGPTNQPCLNKTNYSVNPSFYTVYQAFDATIFTFGTRASILNNSPGFRWKRPNAGDLIEKGISKK